MLYVNKRFDEAISEFNKTHNRLFNGLTGIESIGDCEKMQKVVNDFSKIAHLDELPGYATIIHV